MATTTTWASSNLGGIVGCVTDNTYVYVSYKYDPTGGGGSYGTNVSRFLLTNSSNRVDFEYSSGNGTGAGVLCLDSGNQLLYIPDFYSNAPVISILTYPTLAYDPNFYSMGFTQYDDESDPQNPQYYYPPVPVGMVIAGSYLYCAHGDYLSRFVLPVNSSGYGNDTGFGGPGAFGSPPYYNSGGYNDLNSTLVSSGCNGLATDGTYLYVSCNTGKIVKMLLSSAASGGASLTTSTLVSGLSALGQMTISNDNLYLYVVVAVTSTRNILKIDASTGSTITTYNLGGSYSTQGALQQFAQLNGSSFYVASGLYTGTPSTDLGSILLYGESNTGNVVCFGENSKILCFNPEKSIDEYVSIKNIGKGTLVKTLFNGYKPVFMMGKSTVQNVGNDSRIKDRLYKCSKKNYPEMLDEDLIITGAHSILVDSLTDEQREKIKEEFKKIYVTDKKYRLFTFLDPRAEPYQVEGEFSVFHMALESEHYDINYGIYANGLVVETCSQKYLKEISKMTLY